MRASTVLAIGMIVVGGFGLVTTIMGAGSVRDHIAETYTAAGTEPIPGDDDVALVYTSSDPVSETAEDIAGARKPADRRTTAAGTFLRYAEDIVSVFPRGEGSKILVEDEDSGYRHHFVYLGGWWGRYSGPAESFRGGGPGGGK